MPAITYEAIQIADNPGFWYGAGWSRLRSAASMLTLPVGRVVCLPVLGTRAGLVIKDMAVAVMTVGTSVTIQMGIYLPHPTTRLPDRLWIDGGAQTVTVAPSTLSWATWAPLVPGGILWLAVLVVAEVGGAHQLAAYASEVTVGHAGFRDILSAPLTTTLFSAARQDAQAALPESGSFAWETHAQVHPALFYRLGGGGS